MIKNIQIEPFGYCNAKCWFCPVKYKPQADQSKTHMSIEDAEQLLDKLTDARENGLISKSALLHTAHYNEFILYKYLEQFMVLLKKYNWRIVIYSNAIALNKHRANIINRYSDYVAAVSCNIPAFDQETWGKFMGVNSELFNAVVDNVSYLSELRSVTTYITINGISQHLEDSDIITSDALNDLLPLLTKEEHDKQYAAGTKMFPYASVHKTNDLYDRAGNLPIFTDKHSKQGKVIGCGLDDRHNSWLHLDAFGNNLICCSDYESNHILGNIKNQSIDEFWNSNERKERLDHAKETLCVKCVHAKY